MGKPTTIWTYRNEHGRPMGHVARYDIPAPETDPADKVIWPWTFGIREEKREWCVGALPAPRVTFHLALLVNNPDTPIFWPAWGKIGIASCRERIRQDVELS